MGTTCLCRKPVPPLIEEYNVYSWDEKKPNCPEDRNDHCVNAEQYAWLPYKEQIG